MSTMLDATRACEAFEDQLERSDLTLPVMPGVAGQVIQMTMDDDADAAALAKLIETDTSLAGHIMRVANSAMYRPSSPFVSLQQVIARLGMATITEIALATALNTDLFAAPGSESLLAACWHESLLTSAWAREIARMRRTNVEMAFLGGMLARVGMPVAVQGLVSAGVAGSAVAELAEHYEVRAGALLGRAWVLPAAVQQCVLHHPDPLGASKHPDEVVNTAIALAFAQGEEIPLELTSAAGLYPEDLEVLEGQTAEIEAWVGTVGGGAP